VTRPTMAQLAPLAPRLLRVSEAAAYCRLGPESFLKVCPVPARRLAPGPRGLRWDRRELDRWIDGLDVVAAEGASSPPKSKDEWLALLDDENPRARA